jgi:integrase
VSPRLPRGLTRDKKGWRIYVSRGVHREPFRRHYPPSLSEEQMIDELRAQQKSQRAGRLETGPIGTLSADVNRYLVAYFASRPGRLERERHLKLWIAELGADIWRRQITREEVSRILQKWRTSGLSAETCNHRRTALLAMWNALDGKSAANPVRDVPRFTVPPPLPRAIPYPLIERALKQLPKCRTRARLKLMAYTGARPVQIRKIQAADWNRKAKTLLLAATSKGAGTKPHAVPLSPQAEAAMREFDETDAWGHFGEAPLCRMWKRAAIAVGLPASCVPYDLRHSWGTQIYRATGDLRITADLMGHASLAMSQRYTLAAVQAGERRAVQVAFPKAKPRREAKARKTANR